MMEPAHAGETMPRAYLGVGGASLARHQLVLALAAGCERIVCLAHALDQELIELQHEAEQAGARFHMISGPRALSGLLTAADELLVMVEGLVPAQEDALELIGRAPVVLVLPAETAIPRGFERIDINHAGAGLMVLPGRLVERLNDLPPDAEPVSALLRIALQAGTPQRLVPQSTAASGRWLLVRDEAEAHAAELGWMERYTASRSYSPGQGLAGFAVRHLGPTLLHAGSGSRMLIWASLAIAALAAGVSWFGYVSLGLGMIAPAWLASRCGVIIAEIQSDALGQRPSFLVRTGLMSWMLDAVLLAMLTAAMPTMADGFVGQRAFAPVVLIGMLRLLARTNSPKWGAWLQDRMLLVLVLCGLSVSLLLAPGVAALAVVLLLAGILLPQASAGITRA